MIMLNARPYIETSQQNTYCANIALNGWFALIRNNGNPNAHKISNRVSHYPDGEVLTLSNVYR
ncbi:MAG: hypothetical protein ACR2QF_11945, partial [Geminicoccaceae bacterium]